MILGAVGDGAQAWATELAGWKDLRGQAARVVAEGVKRTRSAEARLLGDQRIEGDPRAVELGFHVREKLVHIGQALDSGVMFEFFRGNAQCGCTEIGRASFDAVGGTGESRDVAGTQAHLELDDPLWGVFKKDARDLPQKLIIVSGI